MATRSQREYLSAKRQYREGVKAYKEDVEEYKGDIEEYEKRLKTWKEKYGGYIKEGARGKLTFAPSRPLAPRTTKQLYKGYKEGYTKLKEKSEKLGAQQKELKETTKGLKEKRAKVISTGKEYYGRKTPSVGDLSKEIKQGTLSELTTAYLKEKGILKESGESPGYDVKDIAVVPTEVSRDTIEKLDPSLQGKQWKKVNDRQLMVWEDENQTPTIKDAPKVEPTITTTRRVYEQGVEVRDGVVAYTPSSFPRGAEPMLYTEEKFKEVKSLEQPLISSQTKYISRRLEGLPPSLSAAGKIAIAPVGAVAGMGEGAALAITRPDEFVSGVKEGLTPSGLGSQYRAIKRDPYYEVTKLATEFYAFGKLTSPLAKRLGIKSPTLAKIKEGKARVLIPEKYYAKLKGTSEVALEGGTTLTIKEVFSILPEGIRQVPVVQERTLQVLGIKKALSPKVGFLEPTARGRIKLAPSGKSVLVGKAKVKWYKEPKGAKTSVYNIDKPGLFKRSKIIKEMKTRQESVQEFFGEASYKPSVKTIKTIGGRTGKTKNVLKSIYGENKVRAKPKVAKPKKKIVKEPGYYKVTLKTDKIRGGRPTKTAGASETKLIEIKQKSDIMKMTPAERLDYLRGARVPKSKLFYYKTKMAKLKQKFPARESFPRVSRIKSGSIKRGIKEGYIKVQRKGYTQAKPAESIKVYKEKSLTSPLESERIYKTLKGVYGKKGLDAKPTPPKKYPKPKKRTSEVSSAPTSRPFTSSAPSGQQQIFSEGGYAFPKQKAVGITPETRQAYVQALGENLNLQMTEVAKNIPVKTSTIKGQRTFGTIRGVNKLEPKSQTRLETRQRTRLETRAEPRARIDLKLKPETRTELRQEPRLTTRLQSRLASRLTTRLASRQVPRTSKYPGYPPTPPRTPPASFNIPLKKKTKEGDLFKVKKTKKIRKPKYAPSLVSVAYDIKDKKKKSPVTTGLEIRPK